MASREIQGFRDYPVRQRGAVVFSQGDAIPLHQPVYQVVRGLVVREDARGPEGIKKGTHSVAIAEVLKSGDFFGVPGESDQRYSTTVRALQPTTLIVASMDEVDGAGRLAIARNTEQRALRLEQAEEILRRGEIPQLVPFALLDFAAGGSRVLVSGEDLARRIGRKRQTVSGELASLTREGLIVRTGKGSLAIVDGDELRRRAGSVLIGNQTVLV